MWVYLFVPVRVSVSSLLKTAMYTLSSFLNKSDPLCFPSISLYFVFHFLSLSLSLFLSFTLCFPSHNMFCVRSICFSLTLSVICSLDLSLSPFLFLSLAISLTLSLSLCLSLSLPFSLSLPCSLSLSLSLSPAHVTYSTLGYSTSLFAICYFLHCIIHSYIIFFTTFLLISLFCSFTPRSIIQSFIFRCLFGSSGSCTTLRPVFFMSFCFLQTRKQNKNKQTRNQNIFFRRQLLQKYA